MKKFGFGKKADKNSATTAAPASNPYAQPKVASDPYLEDESNMGSSPNYAMRQSNGLPNGPGAVRNGGPNSNTGYGGDRYGSGAGYGANRYDTPSNGNDLGGYGGMGARNSNEMRGTEENRDALFGGAKDRYAQRGPPLGAGRPTGGYGTDSTGSGGRYGGGYGEERQLTQEEEEEEEIAATKQEIRLMKKDDVSSTQRALAIAAQAEETGRATLGRLGAQSERLYNTEKNLDLVANSNRKAEEKAKELKTLNRSMFAVHVSNPFTSSSRRAARDEEIQTKHQQEREQREATRQAAFNSRSRFEGSMRGIEDEGNGYRPQTKASFAERSRYQFEADSEDEEMENQIDRNLDALGQAAGRLNALAKATGKEVEEQNKHIDRIMVKSDRVDDQINMNRARLDRIK
ncbi:Protein transport protein sec9 [Erysiphe neolycopersici]|uniref:Protein transport protein SEC9 n=1 Tax=Erysiphe neolycopersici TaxID=212602 RepID=A0A420HHV8_9PEZI|nr:Protein transport protein sec9 [Erysiphe neolycopersici]